MIMTHWTSKYHNRDEFLSWFSTEQEYVDAMFAQIIMFNYGKFVQTPKPRKIRFE